jgi:segregation and condensation protein B
VGGTGAPRADPAAAAGDADPGPEGGTDVGGTGATGADPATAGWADVAGSGTPTADQATAVPGSVPAGDVGGPDSASVLPHAEPETELPAERHAELQSGRDASGTGAGAGGTVPDDVRPVDGPQVAPGMDKGSAGDRAEQDREPDGSAAAAAGVDAAPVADEGTEGLSTDDLASPDRLRAALEAVLFVVDVPTSSTQLAQVLRRPLAEVDAALRALRHEYDATGRGLDLREVADGWRLFSRDDFSGYVERFVLDGQQARLTQAALETLAVIAYRQPVTRSRISGIRGVSVDAVMRTLLTRGLVEECGADPDTGGGLYRTTRLFLEKLGLRSLDELPSLAPLLPDTSQLDDVAVST